VCRHPRILRIVNKGRANISLDILVKVDQFKAPVEDIVPVGEVKVS